MQGETFQTHSLRLPVPVRCLVLTPLWEGSCVLPAACGGSAPLSSEERQGSAGAGGRTSIWLSKPLPLATGSVLSQGLLSELFLGSPQFF